MTRSVGGVLALAGALCWGAAAAASIVPASQKRYVLAAADDGVHGLDYHRINATGMGPFQAAVSAKSGSEQAEAQQFSTIDPWAVILRGTAGSNGLGHPFTTLIGESWFELAFHLEKPVPFMLDGFFESEGSDAGGQIWLYGPDMSYLFVATPGHGTDTIVALSGILEPGFYLLQASAAASSFGGSACTAEFNLTLTVPPPAAAGVLVFALPLALRRRR